MANPLQPAIRGGRAEGPSPPWTRAACLGVGRAGILEQALRKSATTLISSRARNETRFGREVALSFKDTSATRCTNEELPES